MWETVEAAIRAANAILPGLPAPDGEEDSRWQALLAIAAFAETDPDPIWAFVAHWGQHECDDLRMGISTCLLEHLLEHHFDRIFPRVEKLAIESERFADTFSHVWKFGQSTLPANVREIDALRIRLGIPVYRSALSPD